MKILQIVQKPQRRGAEVFTFQLSQELYRQGHEVQTVYLYPYDGPGGLPLQEQDHVLPGQEDHPFEKFLGFHPQLLHKLKQVIQEFGPEVIQVNGARTVKYGAFLHHLNRNSSWILIYRNIGQPQEWVRGRQRYWFYRKLVMPQVDGIVGVSQATLQSIGDFYGLSKPVAYIPNGVDPTLTPVLSREETRHQTRTPAEAPVLLFVGSLSTEKRPDRLLRLLDRASQDFPDVHLWLVGDGPLRAELMQQAEALGLNERVRFLGIQAEVASYMKAADVLVLTSDTEGIPAVVLEAGLLGLPVVATRVGGLSECVKEGETGLLVDPQDEPQLAQRVCLLLQNPVQHRQMGCQAAVWVRSTYTMDKIAQQYLDFYQQVLAA